MTGSDSLALFQVEGLMEEIFAVRVAREKVIPQAQLARATELCNCWNVERRWPKVYVRVAGGVGRLVCEQQLDLTPGIRRDLFVRFSRTSLDASFAFLAWMNREHKI